MTSAGRRHVSRSVSKGSAQWIKTCCRKQSDPVNRVTTPSHKQHLSIGKQDGGVIGTLYSHIPGGEGECTSLRIKQFSRRERRRARTPSTRNQHLAIGKRVGGLIAAQDIHVPR